MRRGKFTIQKIFLPGIPNIWGNKYLTIINNITKGIDRNKIFSKII
jgi:hypothetical protein